ncbi:hypothetical protein HOW07_07535 [Plantibacter sp. MCCC 1A11337]|uniref:hypothetical protein n=1 Tax=Plantibacter sp. MCCC 1A11337 TaxID=2736644 RepID=UPI001582D0F8|nr:hypothetical protein [Plantibacter sp. MCCC 1A11337]NUJ87856.1 hypothetical protein [Plantibacter sp. MCCC 1A11337]
MTDRVLRNSDPGDLDADVRAELTTRLSELRGRQRLDAVVEASRAAVLAAVPRLRSAQARLARDSGGDGRRASRTRWGARDTATVVALLLGLLAAGLVLPSPRNGRPALGVDEAAMWVGLCAIVSAVIFGLLERGRLTSFLLGAHTRGAARLYVVVGVVWTVVFAYVVVSWDEVDRYEPARAMTGLVLLGIAVAGIAALAVVARRRDRVALADPITAAKDEWGRSPGDVDPLRQWWAALPSTLTPTERRAADRSYGVTLEVLEGEKMVRARDARRLRCKNPAAVWRGDAG